MRHTISFTQEEAEAVYEALMFYADETHDDEQGVPFDEQQTVNLVRKALTKFEAVTTTQEDPEGMEDEREAASDDDAGSG